MADRLPTVRHLSPGTVVIGAEGEWVEVRGPLLQPRYGRYLTDDELGCAIEDLERDRARRWNRLAEDGA